jgi:cytochrome c553
MVNRSKTPEVLFRVFAFLTLAVLGSTLLVYNTSSQTKMPETITLAKEAKLGPVMFNHLKHATEKRSPDGTKQIECVECHHTAQPATEAAKHPPHKTAWPADRTTTLTAELLEKDATTTVVVCTDCHARADQKPKLLPEIPSVKFEGATEATVMNNQQAFHRNCGGCHDDVVKSRATLDPAPPTSKKCVACHKKAAA